MKKMIEAITFEKVYRLYTQVAAGSSRENVAKVDMIWANLCLDIEMRPKEKEDLLITAFQRLSTMKRA